MKGKYFLISIFLLSFAFMTAFILAAAGITVSFHSSQTKESIQTIPTPPVIQANVFVDHFKVAGVLNEAGSIQESENQYWWVNSGGELLHQDGIGETVQGDLPATNKWRVAYAHANALDTDQGYHPQNIFRFVSRDMWTNYSQSAYFLITKDNLSDSPNRNESNGLLLFNRYQDGSNLYYAGVRVDGAAVIKKKQNGIYYTMVYQQIFPGVYDHKTNPNMLPKNTWIGLKVDVTNGPNNTVTINLYTDIGKTGTWTLAATTVDNGTQYGSGIIAGPASVGIRTDFMDVQFSDYTIKSL